MKNNCFYKIITRLNIQLNNTAKQLISATILIYIFAQWRQKSEFIHMKLDSIAQIQKSIIIRMHIDVDHRVIWQHNIVQVQITNIPKSIIYALHRMWKKPILTLPQWELHLKINTIAYNTVKLITLIIIRDLIIVELNSSSLHLLLEL